ncbi:hypothetical protein KKC1_23090 [Calderihabitans maritimus]|uniref:Uncharacterized protein n=1 Tax=Calderihabitans maritimus TaxID=1246530 RepID=A0A1Z5HUT2_9FIRM|nr:hypothetical protein KKC1_23090 [Calderihabitans maritimus]
MNRLFISKIDDKLFLISAATEGRSRRHQKLCEASQGFSRKFGGVNLIIASLS